MVQLNWNVTVMMNALARMDSVEQNVMHVSQSILAFQLAKVCFYINYTVDYKTDQYFLSEQNANVMLKVQLLWIVMQKVIALARMDSVARSVR